MAMKKTKIICSIGPASSNLDVFVSMVQEGMNVARVNFSHASYEDADEVIRLVTEANKVTGKHVAVLFDTKGPEFRCEIMEDEVMLTSGNKIRVVKESVIGNSERFSVNHSESLNRIKVGDTLLLDDGLLNLEVCSKEEDGITCDIIEGGILKSKKSINVPGVDLGIPFVSEVDRKDIEYVCRRKESDFLALSFVESKRNVDEVRKILKGFNRKDIQIISKIESSDGIAHLDEIIKASDGIMVARGDLGVELPLYDIPIFQKMMIDKCRQYGKFVIVATEMLASMYVNVRPTRAEVSDIANAVLDGCDAVMLSGETTVGRYPARAVKYMAEVCASTENHYNCNAHVSVEGDTDITMAIAKAVLASVSSLDVKAIVVPTMGGHSAKVMSNLRPNPIVLATCPTEKVARSLALNFGVYSKVVKHYDTMDETVHESKKEAKEFLDLKENDIIIVTGGIHDNPDIKQTNFLKVEEI